MHENSLTAYANLDKSQRRQEVFAALLQLGKATRNEIAEKAGLPLATVCGRIRYLLDENRVVETDQVKIVMDRPRQVLQVNDNFLKQILG